MDGNVLSGIIGFGGSILGAIIGGISTYKSENNFRKRDNEEQIMHYSSMLYYDLKSIEKYLAHERGSVNIRYSDKWQHIVAQCLFLSKESVEYIYKIYDYVYNYNFHYNLKTEEGIAVIKEDILEYKLLRKMFFDNSKGYIDENKENIGYKKILEELKNKQK